MRRRPGAVVDLARALTITTTRDGRSKRKGLDRLKLQEIEHQIQLPFKGYTATDQIPWISVDVEWDVQFVTNTTQRFSNVPYPHLDYSVFLENKDDPDINPADIPVGRAQVIVQVESWVRDQMDCFVGCGLMVGMYSPGLDLPLHVNGYLLLSFQGFGALTDAEGGIGG